jgi:DNA polymerase-3 subunit delta
LTPEQLRAELKKGQVAPAYLFAGPEGYQRRQSRRLLTQTFFGGEPPGDDSLTEHDLDEQTLTEVLDDARALSLFTSKRMIWVSSAEAALPRGRGSEESGDNSALAAYAKRPTPEVLLVFDARRFEFEGEDKTRMERLLKFYAPVPVTVEFRPLSAEAARQLAQDLIQKNGLKLGLAELGMLIEACGGDALRLANEVEKLSLYAGTGRAVTAEDLAALVPSAQASNIFALVGAMGRGDRGKALAILDVLVREGEYLPLALTFVAAQFRYALMAQESNLRTPQQIVGHFTKLGIRMWPQRAAEVQQTTSSFSQKRVEQALRLLFGADRGLRDQRPDDRTVFENLILELTR